MPLREIPRYRWAQFAEAFNRDHLGAVCTLEVDSSVAGMDTEARAWPFQGLALETGHDTAPRVQVFLGDGRDRHLGHALVDPHHFWIEENAEGAQTGLRIDADEGAVHLRFRSPARPGHVETHLP
jgi:hypothetical protein